MITEVRDIRSTFQVPQKVKLELLVRAPWHPKLLHQHESIIQRLASVEQLIGWSHKEVDPAGSVVTHVGRWELVIPLAKFVDVKKERDRIHKQIDNLHARAKSKRTRLADPAFRSRAPSDVVAEEEESLKELDRELIKWNESLRWLQ